MEEGTSRPASLLFMQQQISAQNQSVAPPAEKTPVQETQAAGQPDVAAMMAELEALRAQVAGQNSQSKAQASRESDIDDIVKEFSGKA